MFNRNSSQPVKVEKTFISVILTLIDGETLNGAIALAQNSCLGDLLNSSDKYVLFKTNAGEPIYLALTTIAAVQSNEKPVANHLETSLKKLAEINPYQILKVKPGVDKPGLRTAYHELVKDYHPDQFVNTNLPSEVLAYLDAVLLRLNAAYEELVGELDRQEQLRQMALAAKNTPKIGTIQYFGQ